MIKYTKSNPVLFALGALGIVFVSMLIVNWYFFALQKDNMNRLIVKQNKAIEKVLKKYLNENTKKLEKQIVFYLNLIEDGMSNLLFNYEKEKAKEFVQPYLQTPEIMAVKILEYPDKNLFLFLKDKNFNQQESVVLDKEIIYEGAKIGKVILFYDKKGILNKYHQQSEKIFQKTKRLKQNLIETTNQTQEEIFIIIVFLMLALTIIVFAIVLFLSKSLKKHSTQLEELNKNLSIKIDEAVKKEQKNKKMILEQQKLINMGGVLGDIAHQWRQPLNVVALLVQEIEMMYGEISEEELHKMIKDAMEQIEFMSKTIDKFRNYYKPSNGKTKFDIKDAIIKSYHMLKHQLKEKNIEVEFHFNKTESFVVEGYISEWNQIVHSLVANSKDSILKKQEADSDLKGKIDFFITKEQDSILIKICDNGTGIKGEHLEKLFEPYFTTKHKSVGTGMSLYVSKILVEEYMRGKIYAENMYENNKIAGVCFNIVIPIEGDKDE